MADDGAEGSGVSDNVLRQQVQQRTAEVQRLMQTNNKSGALLAAIDNPPVATRNQSIKDDNFAAVSRVLSNVSDSDLAGVVSGLSLEQCDVLMKYVYRMLAQAENCATMLKLHALLTEKAGSGAIVRALADRKTV